jgi:4-hydroxy-tetrahydrodipicolinate reductase
MKIAIAGAAGRMGQALIEAVASDAELELVVAHDVAGVGNAAGKVKITPDNKALSGADVVIDFTRPEATVANLAHAKAMVIGTTGLSDKDKAAIARAAERMPIVLSPNFAVGVNVIFKLAEMAAQTLGAGYDVEILEAHHRNKVDAPSGTALRLGEIIAAVLKKKDFSFGRQGDTGVRPAKQIGIHAVRGGDIVGEHTVMFAGPGERIELVVRSQSRMTYALGAVRAAKWLKDRPAGLYDMFDVLGLR